MVYEHAFSPGILKVFHFFSQFLPISFGGLHFSLHRNSLSICVQRTTGRIKTAHFLWTKKFTCHLNFFFPNFGSETNTTHSLAFGHSLSLFRHFITTVYLHISTRYKSDLVTSFISLDELFVCFSVGFVVVISLIWLGSAFLCLCRHRCGSFIFTCNVFILVELAEM